MAFRNPQCHVVVTNVISAWGLLLLLLKNWINFSLIPTFVETRDKLRPWPPRQQAVLALCQWPQSPQNWQMDKARSFYSTTEEELTAAISSTYFCKGGTAMQLPEELTTFKKNKESFLPLSLWGIDCEFQFLISQVCYQRPTRAAVCIYRLCCFKWLSHHVTTPFFVGVTSKSGASILEMKIRL